MNAKRLAKLLDVALNLDQASLDMSGWRCGTKACLAGHYVMKNPGCGLLFKSDTNGYEYITDDKGLTPFSALSIHFGLSLNEVLDLFRPKAATKRELAENIRRVISEYALSRTEPAEVADRLRPILDSIGFADQDHDGHG